MASLFVSYSHSDKDFVRRLCIDLESHGHHVWLDEKELVAGDSIVREIRKAIDYVDYVLIVISQNALGSEWVRREIDVATSVEIARHERFVIPLLTESMPLPDFLEGKLYADFTSIADYTVGLGLLLRSVSASTARTFIKRDRLVLDARAIRTYYNEILYAVGQYGIGVLTTWSDEDISSLLPLFELERSCAEGYVAGIKFVLDLLKEKPAPTNTGVAGVFKAASVVLTARLTAIYDTGSDPHEKLAKAGVSVSAGHAIDVTGFPPSWRFPINALREYFREGDLKTFYVGVLQFAAQLDEISGHRSDGQSVSYVSLFARLYGLLFLVLRATEFVHYRYQFAFWGNAENLLRQRLGLSYDVERLVGLAEASAEFAETVPVMLKFDESVAPRFRMRLRSMSEEDAFSLLMLELKAAYVYTGSYREDETGPTLTMGVSLE